HPCPANSSKPTAISERIRSATGLPLRSLSPMVVGSGSDWENAEGCQYDGDFASVRAACGRRTHGLTLEARLSIDRRRLRGNRRTFLSTLWRTVTSHALRVYTRARSPLQH